MTFDQTLALAPSTGKRNRMFFPHLSSTCRDDLRLIIFPPHVLLLLVLLFTLDRLPVSAQETATSAPASSSVLSKMEAGFSNGQVVHTIQLSGTVTRHAGSAQDSGTINLIASADGSSQVKLVLTSTGTIVETQETIGVNRSCNRSGSVGVVHDSSGFSCSMPLVWFLPQVTLQSAVLSPSLGTTYQGIQNTAWGACHVVTSQVIPDSATKATVSFAQLQKLSSATLYLDSAATLPRALTFVVPPSSGTSGNSVEILYSNYRNISGVLIPTHIERHLNGSLELALEISQVSILN